MQSPKCLFSASTALRHVFLEPALPRYITCSPKISIKAQQWRSYATPPKPVDRRLPRDSEIRNTHVNVIDEYGVFHESVLTRNVLRSINPRTHHLVAVTQPPYDWKEPAICRILSKIEVANLMAEEKKQLKEAKKKVPERVVKTLEMNWAIDNNDLGHRIEKMKEFLGKGNKVEVLISPKRKSRVVGVVEAEALLKRLRDVVDGEEGSKNKWKEGKPMEGVVAGKATLFFEGKVVGSGTSSVGGKEDDGKQDEKSGKGTGDEEEKERELTRRQAEKRDKWKKKENGELVDPRSRSRPAWAI